MPLNAYQRPSTFIVLFMSCSISVSDIVQQCVNVQAVERTVIWEKGLEIYIKPDVPAALSGTHRLFSTHKFYPSSTLGRLSEPQKAFQFPYYFSHHCVVLPSSTKVKLSWCVGLFLTSLFRGWFQ